MANKGIRVRTGRRIRVTPPKIFVQFQQRPGHRSDNVILDAGTGKLHLPDGTEKRVEPKNGIYELNVIPGKKYEFEIFGTRFRINSLTPGRVEKGKSPSITSWQNRLISKGSLRGSQQRLQLLGYYTGRVDGKMGQKSERAILEFQADDGSLVIDGVAGPKTYKKLNAFFKSHGKDLSGTHHLIRKYLVRFERGTKDDTKWNYPHPDYRTGGRPQVGFGLETGFRSWLLKLLGVSVSNKSFKVGIQSENLTTLANLHLSTSSGQDNVVELGKSLSSPGVKKKRLTLRPKSVGTEVVRVHSYSPTGPVIGSINVVIPDIKEVYVTAHILDIFDSAGKHGEIWKSSEIKSLIEIVNAIWLPVGIEFSLRTIVNKKWTLKVAGAIKDLEYLKIWRKDNLKNRINIYFVERLISSDKNGVETENTLGFALPRKAWSGNPGPIGACVKKDKDLFNLAQTVAHELGHVLDLTPNPSAHTDEDKNQKTYRHDVWSRTRLMARYSVYGLNSPPRRWQDTGYEKRVGGMACGSMISILNLSNDDTDNEYIIARRAAINPY